MSLKIRIQKQICIHWPRIGTDEYGRAAGWGTPVEKACRWDGVSEKFVNAQGEEQLSRATVLVDDVAVGDVLMLGMLEDSGLDLDDPLENEGAWVIQRYDSTPNFRNTETFCQAYL